MSRLLKMVEDLLEAQMGDLRRLEHVRQCIEMDKRVYTSDEVYVRRKYDNFQAGDDSPKINMSDVASDKKNSQSDPKNYDNDGDDHNDRSVDDDVNYSDIKSSDSGTKQRRNPSRIWYLLPIFLNLLGGLIVYAALRKSHNEYAKRMLLIGAGFFALGVTILVVGSFDDWDDRWADTGTSSNPIPDNQVQDDSHPTMDTAPDPSASYGQTREDSSQVADIIPEQAKTILAANALDSIRDLPNHLCDIEYGNELQCTQAFLGIKSITQNTQDKLNRIDLTAGTIQTDDCNKAIEAVTEHDQIIITLLLHTPIFETSPESIDRIRNAIDAFGAVSYFWTSVIFDNDDCIYEQLVLMGQQQGINIEQYAQDRGTNLHDLIAQAREHMITDQFTAEHKEKKAKFVESWLELAKSGAEYNKAITEFCLVQQTVEYCNSLMSSMKGMTQYYLSQSVSDNCDQVYIEIDKQYNKLYIFDGDWSHLDDDTFFDHLTRLHLDKKNIHHAYYGLMKNTLQTNEIFLNKWSNFMHEYCQL